MLIDHIKAMQISYFQPKSDYISIQASSMILNVVKLNYTTFIVPGLQERSALTQFAWPILTFIPQVLF